MRIAMADTASPANTGLSPKTAASSPKGASPPAAGAVVEAGEQQGAALEADDESVIKAVRHSSTPPRRGESMADCAWF